MDTTRRNFLKGAVGTIVLGMAGDVFAHQGLGIGEKFDLVIRNGEVLDPSQKLRAKKDIGIKNGIIVLIADKIPEDQSAQSIDAAGKLVTPGLVDLHGHVYPYGSAIGLPADEIVNSMGATTYLDPGDAGANNLGALKNFIIPQSRCRIFGLLHISSIGLAGFPVGECLNLDYCDTELAAKVLSENYDTLLGMKVRQSANCVGGNGLEPLKRAITAAEQSGTKGIVMCHIGDVPQRLEELLDMLRPGDIVAHMYAGAGKNNIVQNGKLLPEALAAQKRGVIMEVAHGAGSFNYKVAVSAIEQGLIPNVISSDIHGYSINSPSNSTLPMVMSKFLNMGFSLEDVIAMATVNPAKAIGRVDKLGTLQLGAPGDVSILELIEEPIKLVDTQNNYWDGSKYLKPFKTICAGRPFGGPYSSPFLKG